MPLHIVTADQRLAERSGVKAVIFGPYKIGKTSLLRTLDASRTLFVNIEAGDLAVQDVPVAEVRPDGDTQWSWPELQDLAAVLGGPNPARPGLAYCPDHYEEARAKMGDLGLDRFDTLFIDSLTVASRICLAWCKTRPEAVSEKKGTVDTRAVYGLLGQELVAWITQLQHARGKNVVFLALLDRVKDDYGSYGWEPQIEGQATAKALPGIVDQVLTMQDVAFPGKEGEPPPPPIRCFVTKQGNPHGFPAGDRSGRLDPYEEPHLGKLIAKVTDQSRARYAYATELTQAQD